MFSSVATCSSPFSLLADAGAGACAVLVPGWSRVAGAARTTEMRENPLACDSSDEETPAGDCVEVGVSEL